MEGRFISYARNAERIPSSFFHGATDVRIKSISICRHTTVWFRMQWLSHLRNCHTQMKLLWFIFNASIPTANKIQNKDEAMAHKTVEGPTLETFKRWFVIQVIYIHLVTQITRSITLCKIPDPGIYGHIIPPLRSDNWMQSYWEGLKRLHMYTVQCSSTPNSPALLIMHTLMIPTL